MGKDFFERKYKQLLVWLVSYLMIPLFLGWLQLVRRMGAPHNQDWLHSQPSINQSNTQAINQLINQSKCKQFSISSLLVFFDSLCFSMYFFYVLVMTKLSFCQEKNYKPFFTKIIKKIKWFCISIKPKIYFTSDLLDFSDF